jgi:hypothetical protein
MMPGTHRTTNQESMSLYRNRVPQALSHIWGQCNPNYCTNRAKFVTYGMDVGTHAFLCQCVHIIHHSPEWQPWTKKLLKCVFHHSLSFIIFKTQIWMTELK